MSNQMDRERKEMKNLFDDPKFARKAWRAVGHAIANMPATKLPAQYDKEGNILLSSEIEQYSYNTLANDIRQLGKEDRPPTQLEMVLQCQFVKARFDTAAATFIRDTLGAKPVDESKLDHTVVNEYESLSDEELELLAAHRAKQQIVEQTEAVSEHEQLSINNETNSEEVHSS